MNFGPIFDVVGKVIDRVIPDTVAAEKAKADLLATAQTQEFQLAVEQIRVNAEEAKSTNWFVSSWRPAIGWVCALAFAYNFLAYPLLLWFVAITKVDITPPSLVSDSLMELTLGMLGMAGFRMYETVRGVKRI